MLIQIFAVYLIILNIIGFVLMGLDKRKARREQWRTPEKHFFIVAWLGGSLGCWLGMKMFHHKTRHKTFTVGIPAILVVQILFIFFLCEKGFLV